MWSRGKKIEHKKNYTDQVIGILHFSIVCVCVGSFVPLSMSALFDDGI